MKNTVNYQVESISFYSRVSKAFPLLNDQKMENDRVAFDDLMEELLPEVKEYIKRQIIIAVKNNTLPEGKYKVEDFTDELYVQAYDHIQELTASGAMPKWLFSKADEILEETVIEEDFDSMFFKNIDDYTKDEQEAMQELFTHDGDGDLVMLEELDDLSYSTQNYTLEDIFVDDIETDLLEKIDTCMTKEAIHRQIESVLLFLPFNMRTIFELSVYQRFKSDEIAEIKKITISEVEDTLMKAKRLILEYL